MKPSPDTAPNQLLGTGDHSRDSAGMTYVYPVVSRRAGGVSVGINLNPNNACNWRCIYCQVPDLKRGNAPPIDLAQLETELRSLLDDLVHGDFMARRVPFETRRIEDIAFSGNGEPTSAREFSAAVELARRLRDEFSLDAKLRLITNGSLIDRPAVQEGIAHLGAAAGEVWFKLDAGTRQGIARINGVDLDPAGIVRRLRKCAELCSTWVQTCCFSLDGRTPGDEEIAAWLDLLKQVQATEEAASKTTKTTKAPSGTGKLAGVHLYGLARPSMQSEASRLERLPADWLETLALQVRQLGLRVRISP
ncbi:conserved protein of unknown function [Sterolibacterium denitrificans]|uniref:Radical SAM core domain-containing protein n=2 Tax=Sterolibacterium denitrificans TaxID=157592 RepID=A0A7Z7HSN9_9PROT|nr:conserved protein of unknown function [Sterolibacterium denitrificans]